LYAEILISVNVYTATADSYTYVDIPDSPFTLIPEERTISNFCETKDMQVGGFSFSDTSLITSHTPVSPSANEAFTVKISGRNRYNVVHMHT